jgi:FlaA1/EpsC-like NDP-sugar epimerase
MGVLGDRSLARLATERETSLFDADWRTRSAEIAEAVTDKRVLILGAAGSIGGATTLRIAQLNPACLHLIDQSENNLVELVRDLRARVAVRDLRTWPINVCSDLLGHLIRSMPRYDLVLNFAALKHVRSERDGISVLQMLETNVFMPLQLMRLLDETQFQGTLFSVSTDKAADPTSLMGASKRLMEHVLLSSSLSTSTSDRSREYVVCTARLANVAFSDGSLLDGFGHRLRKHQPLAVPRDARRYFISLDEAGQMSLLVAACTPGNEILIPRMDPTQQLVLLTDVAERVLRHYGFEPVFVEDAGEAADRLESDTTESLYPVVVTPLDTDGEKAVERFAGRDEACREVGMDAILAVDYVPPHSGRLNECLDRLRQLMREPSADPKLDVVRTLTESMPEFHHISRGQSLEERF